MSGEHAPPQVTSQDTAPITLGGNYWSREPSMQESMKDIASLLKGLSQLGCIVQNDEEDSLLFLPESRTSFGFMQCGGWIQTGSVILKESELNESKYIRQLESFVLTFQRRYLGCRFAYDISGNFVIVTDIYPEQQNADHCMTILVQLAFIAETMYHIFKKAIATGEIPDNNKIDALFAET